MDVIVPRGEDEIIALSCRAGVSLFEKGSVFRPANADDDATV